MSQPIISYFDQLELAARNLDVSLPDAFDEAGAGLSTYYRARGGADLRLSTALTVLAAIEAIANRRTAVSETAA